MPALKVEEGRIVRTPFNELVERVEALEAALVRAEVELLAQKQRADDFAMALTTEFKGKLYFMDTYSARCQVEARRSQVPLNELFTSMNFYA